ncbi:acetyl esterase/lipase [Roseimicrobium gellanilyticum]|uniref:Acetyl esterase/lipase n=1 Tax=Roseimicrobium gellanilyticum TaxID=748857 RepID=A0A366HU87_9BACT|nr:family 16 glycoside hydrolase [Roseimicrobium gellanilyticum]RBP47657.1 acetyl esterase/lipase [Roseimicrobium gellanilyticum]
MIIRTALVLAFLATALHAAPPEPPKGFRAIFNSQDLAGWHGLNPHSVAKLTGEKKDAMLKKMREEFPQHWKVENGELVNSGTGPYATTDEEFGDFELMLEYKTVAGADSGIYLRGVPQVQIWDWNQVFDPKKPDRRPHLGSGGLFNNTPKTLGRDPIELKDKPLGQWNTFVIKQIGARTWVTFNTRLVVDGAVMENYWDKTQPFPAKGPIMLQTHGGEIRWRNIYIRDIKEAEAKKFTSENPILPTPTEYDVAYGPHPKQVMHFWKAESDKPTPLLFFVHGGGWGGGGRLSGVTKMLPEMLKAGISVVSVEYRFVNEATKDGVVPPVKGPLHDAARALQTVRSKAKEWNIDKERIGASGGSAGACTSLWLAFHPDKADPKSSDPIARESTRLWCAAVTGAQTSLDPHQMKEWMPNSSYGAHAFGITGDPVKKTSSFAEFHAKRESVKDWIAEYSPYALVTSDDPPIYMSYSAPPAMGQETKDPTHSANFGVKLQEHCKTNGVACELFYPGATDAKHDSTQAYLLEKLKAAK